MFTLPTVNINRKIRRRILDRIPDPLDNPRHPDIINLMRLDESEADDVPVDLVVFRSLASPRYYQHTSRFTVPYLCRVHKEKGNEQITSSSAPRAHSCPSRYTPPDSHARRTSRA